MYRPFEASSDREHVAPVVLVSSGRPSAGGRRTACYARTRSELLHQATDCALRWRRLAHLREEQIPSRFGGRARQATRRRRRMFHWLAGHQGQVQFTSSVGHTLAPHTEKCCLTLRWSRLAPAWHLARFPEWSIIRPAGQAPHRRSRLSSNVRLHRTHSGARGAAQTGRSPGPSARAPACQRCSASRSACQWSCAQSVRARAIDGSCVQPQ